MPLGTPRELHPRAELLAAHGANQHGEEGGGSNATSKGRGQTSTPNRRSWRAQTWRPAMPSLGQSCWSAVRAVISPPDLVAAQAGPPRAIRSGPACHQKNGRRGGPAKRDRLLY